MELKDLKRVGSKTLDVLNKENIYSLEDLIKRIPISYDNYLVTKEIIDQKVTIRGNITTRVINKKMSSRNEFLIFYVDFNGFNLKCLLFGNGYLRYQLKIGQTVILNGRYNKINKYFLVNKIFLEDFEEKIIPHYHLKDLSDTTYNKLVYEAIKNSKTFVDYLPNSLVKKYGLLDYSNYLLYSHFPQNNKELNQVLRRKYYEQYFNYFLRINYACLLNLDKQKKPLDFSMDLVNKFISKLPFDLTVDQKKTLNACLDDLKNTRLANRLICGDVGSGKTIIMFIIAYAAVLANKSVVLLAPTEILVEQHYNKAISYFDNLIKVIMLTSKMSINQKKSSLKEINETSASLIIGTHSLLQNELKFNNLGVILIDEQQRFGVVQRSILKNKYAEVDSFYFTATPIPRSLGLVYLGDLSLSMIKTMPKGRIKIKSYVRDFSYLDKIANFIKERAQFNEQAFVVVPQIDENELNLWDVKMASSYFKEKTNLRVGIIHSKLKQESKQKIMFDFLNHEYDILVSTTIIEVGIDIKDATIMVLLNAERYGLAQAHQLRGRVGRGNKESYFFLVSDFDNERLKTLESIDDGFLLAEKDYLLRGPGDIIGIEQSGFLDDLGNTELEIKIIPYAKEDALEYAKKIKENPKDYSYYLDNVLNSSFNNN